MNLKQNVADFKDAFHAAKEMRRRGPFHFYFFNWYVQTPTMRHDCVIEDTVCLACGIPARLPGACVYPTATKGEYLIFVNEKFTQMPVDFQVAVMAHEEGHIKLGHLENKAKLALNSFLRVFTEPRREYDADAYAYGIVGDIYLDALAELHNYGGKGVQKRILSLTKLKEGVSHESCAQL